MTVYYLTHQQVKELRENKQNLTLKEWSAILGINHGSVWRAYHSISYAYLPPAKNPKPPRGPYPHAKDQRKKI